MAEHARPSVGTRYYKVIGGDFVRKVSADTPGAVERKDKNQNTVHEIHVSELDGMITEMKMRDGGQYGFDVNITLSDAGGNYVIQLPLKSGSAKCFMSILPNLDFAKPVSISVTQKIEGDKKKDSLFVKQDGKALKWAFTKANMNGCPPMVEKEGVGGKKEWDDTEQLKFFYKLVEESAKKVVATPPPVTESPATSFQPEMAGSEVPDGSDLPF